MIADQVRDPLVMVLPIAAVLTLATGDLTDAGVILLVIVVNTTAGVTHEVKAGQAIGALSELTALGRLAYLAAAPQPRRCAADGRSGASCTTGARARAGCSPICR